MAKNVTGGKPRHIYLSTDHALILDAIAKAMGESRISVQPSRSQLIGKAIQNFIQDCRKNRRLKEAVESTEKALQQAKSVAQRQRELASGLRVISRGSTD